MKKKKNASKPFGICVVKLHMPDRNHIGLWMRRSTKMQKLSFEGIGHTCRKHMTH